MYVNIYIHIYVYMYAYIQYIYTYNVSKKWMIINHGSDLGAHTRASARL